MKIVIDIDEATYRNVKNTITIPFNEMDNETISDITSLYRAVKLSKVYAERPQAEWVFRNGVTCVGYYKCSKCGEVERAEKNFCPNCGARMKGGKE